MAEVYKINGAEYECEFLLKDDEGEVKAEFTKSAVKSLLLSENFLEPFQNASILIQNPFDFIDNSHTTRGDGRDFFTISIKLVGGDEKLEYDFVINGESNSTGKTDRSSNLKEYSLLDVNYFKLNEPIPYGTRFRGKIGDIIKTILTGVIGEEIIGEEFEPGDHFVDILPEHVIPNSGFRFSDLIKYLLRINYKKEDDLFVRCFLTFDRTEKVFNLQPLTKIFEKNKDLVYEGFTAGDLINEFEANKNNPPPDAEVNPVLTQLKNTDMTTPMLTYSNEYIMNFLASGYDPILGEHVLEEVRIKDVKKKWEKKFVDVFKSAGGKPKAFLPLNKTKKEALFRTFSFPFTVDKTRNIAEAEMTTNMVFYNLSLTFNNLGDPKRKAGQFIDIYRRSKEQKVDEKLLGRWLVTKCTHSFVYDSYQNTFNCIKTYVGPDAEIKDDIE